MILQYQRVTEKKSHSTTSSTITQLKPLVVVSETENTNSPAEDLPPIIPECPLDCCNLTSPQPSHLNF